MSTPPHGIIDYVDALLALKAAEDDAHTLVSALRREAVVALCETALNVILGNIPSDALQLAKLREHKEDLLMITAPTTSDHTLYRRLGKEGVAKSVLDVAAPLLRTWRRR